MLERPPVIPTGAIVPPVQPATAALLAITDDAELRDMLMELAIEEGYSIRCVTTEAEAAAALHTEPPGLVVADLDMQTRAGTRFLRTLRRSPHRNITCFAVTATNDMMIAVSVDAPVFFKPALDGIAEALARLFRPEPPPATERA